MNINNIPWN